MPEANLSIVMYHYVRDLARTRYPRIKGRTVAEFRRQLDHIAKHYTVVTVAQIIEAVTGGEPLPPNAAWLTFDDGYLDHFSTAFPLLDERGWQGSFFPPVRSARDGELLDVNRIHFILAQQPDVSVLIDAIRSFVEARRGAAGLKPFADYWSELAQASRLDPPETAFVKKILQRALPEAHRGELAATLFERFVSVDPRAFAAELYMNADHLRMMVRTGMYVGSHGVTHRWLSHVDTDTQIAEIDGSLAFLRDLGAPVSRWVMCYPYGEYNDDLLTLLRQRGCAIGLTTRAAIANIGADDPLLLPRLDTNDLPH